MSNWGFLPRKNNANSNGARSPEGEGKATFNDEPRETDAADTFTDLRQGQVMRLYEICRLGNTQGVRDSLSRVVYPQLDAQDWNGATPLCIASLLGHEDIVRLLLERGATVDAADVYRDTPLIHAARHGRLVVAKAFLDYHASPDAVNARGESAVLAAGSAGHFVVVELLLSVGASTSGLENDEDMRWKSPETIHDVVVSFASDIFSLGVCIVKAVTGNLELEQSGDPDAASMDVHRLPESLSPSLWQLIERMRATDSLKRASLLHVIEHLRRFADENRPKVSDQLPDGLVSELSATELHEYVFPELGSTIKGCLEHLESKFRARRAMSKRVALDNNVLHTQIDEVLELVPINHPHILKLYGASHRGKRYFVHENASNGSLDRFLQEDGNATEKWQKLYEVALGLEYLHGRNIVHNDLRCGNILIGADQRQKSLDPKQQGMTVLEAVTGEFAVSDSERADTSASSSSDRGDMHRDHRPAGLTPLQWQLIEGMCSVEPSSRVSLIYVVEQVREFAESKDVVANPEPESVPLDLRKHYCFRLGSSFEDFLRHLEKKCEHQHLYGHSDHVLRRLQDVLDQMVAAKSSHRAIHVKFFENALLSFNFFLGNAVKPDSVRRRARSQTTSLKNGVLHRMVDELLSLGPMVANWKVKSVHRWDPNGVDGSQSDEVPATDTSELNHNLKNNGDQKLSDDSNSRQKKRDIWVEKFDSAHKKNSASDSVTAELGRHSNQPWFIPLYQVAYDPEQPIGYGFFAEIFKGTWLRTPAVIKVLGYEEDREIVSTELFMHELRVWYPLNHPHVIKLFGARHVDKRYFVCEYAPHGTLDQFLRRPGNANKKWQKLYEIALGLQYLHGLNIVHNDLKCDNFLIGVDGKAKISDFGLSCILNCAEVRVNLERHGAVHWKSPEYLRGERVTLASDIYSFGMCILEVVTGEVPWGNQTIDAAIRYHLRKGKIPQRPKNMTDNQWNLVELMCATDPSKRLTISSVVERLYDLAQEEELIASTAS